MLYKSFHKPCSMPDTQQEGWLWTPSRIAKVAAFLLLLPGLTMGVAQRANWPQAWAVICTQFAFTALIGAVVTKRNPSLVQERERATGHENTVGFDRVCVPLVIWITPLIYLAAGLQHRLHLATPYPLSLQIAAAVVLPLSWAIHGSAMIQNHFFSSVVRLQTDRGHKVCSTGPYAIIRHPGYTGASLQVVAEAVLMGSSWALWCAALRGLVLVVRTAKEDAWLQQNLPGYAAYARRVRHRLVPFVW